MDTPSLYLNTFGRLKQVNSHETAEQQLFPRCFVYLRLSYNSWALFKNEKYAK